MWSLPPTDTVLHWLTYVALTPGAMTAALAAGRRSMCSVAIRADGRQHYFARLAFATCAALTAGAALPQALRM